MARLIVQLLTIGAAALPCAGIRGVADVQVSESHAAHSDNLGGRLEGAALEGAAMLKRLLSSTGMLELANNAGRMGNYIRRISEGDRGDYEYLHAPAVILVAIVIGVMIMLFNHGRGRPTKVPLPEAVFSRHPFGHKFLDKYQLGEVIGEGAFGVVYACRKKGTEEQFAVKMVDKAESKLGEIEREVNMLEKLAHPCVVSLLDVYYEKVFVCMVMEIIGGGDLVKSMVRHWKTRGSMSYEVIQNLIKQCLHSLAWLHSKHVIHRDVKGDNFLLDKRELSDLSCRVYLSDFGTVADVKPGQRLSDPVGTNRYWSPEFYDRDYGLPVDIWAIGVLMFGMTTSKFPFKTEQDVRFKEIDPPPETPKDGCDLIFGMLDREEKKRFTAEQALTAPFVAEVLSAAHKELREFDGYSGEIAEKGANIGIVARRRELVERLRVVGQVSSKASLTNGSVSINDLRSSKFVIVQDSQRSIETKYEWWPQSLAQEHNLIDSAAKPVDDSHLQSYLEANTIVLKESLEKHGVNTVEWGKEKAKTVEELAKEVACGSCCLLLDAASYKTIVRVVQLVMVRIVLPAGGSQKYLIKTSEQGRLHQIKQLPGALKQPPMNGAQTAQKIVEEQLGMADCKVVFDFNIKECFEDEEESKSYPGLRTVYRKEIFEGKVTTTDPAILKRIVPSADLKFKDPEGSVRSFTWMTGGQCEAGKIRLSAPKEEVEVSALVNAPVGYEEEELSDLLTAHSIDVSQFGQGTSRSLEEFAAELVAGEAVLARHNGKMARIVDVVLLNIVKDDGSVLVEVSETFKGSTQTLNRLPGIKRRSDENYFLAAQRVLTKVLKIDESSVNLSCEGLLFLEHEKESAAFCGLPTLYHKRFIKGTLATLF